MGEIFSEELQCFWDSWNVFDEHSLALYLPNGCTDMRGCISLGRRLLPSVHRIRVYSEGIPDVLYERTGAEDADGHLFNGQRWKALHLRRAAS